MYRSKSANNQHLMPEEVFSTSHPLVDVFLSMREVAFPFSEEFELDKKQEEMQSVLVDYIFRHNCDRYISPTTVDNVGETCFDQIHLEKEMDEESIEKAKGCLRQWIAAELTNSGVMVVRLIGKGKGGRDIINGSHFSNGKIQVIPGKQLRDSHAKLPNDKHSNDPSPEYQTPYIIFPQYNRKS